MLGKLEIESVLEKSQELDAEETAFGQHAAVLLYAISEILLQGIIHDHHGLTEKCPLLRTSKIEHISQSGDISQGHITPLGCKAITHTGAVNEQRKSIFTAYRAYLAELGQGINRTDLG